MKNWKRDTRSDGVNIQSPLKRFYVHGPQNERLSRRGFKTAAEARNYANRIWPLGHVAIRIVVSPLNVKDYNTILSA